MKNARRLNHESFFLEIDSEDSVEYIHRLKKDFSDVSIMVAMTPFLCRANKFSSNGENSISIFVKPFSLKTLIEEIDKHLERKEVEASQKHRECS